MSGSGRSDAAAVAYDLAGARQNIVDFLLDRILSLPAYVAQGDFYWWFWTLEAVAF